MVKPLLDEAQKSPGNHKQRAVSPCSRISIAIAFSNRMQPAQQRGNVKSHNTFVHHKPAAPASPLYHRRHTDQHVFLQNTFRQKQVNMNKYSVNPSQMSREYPLNLPDAETPALQLPRSKTPPLQPIPSAKFNQTQKHSGLLTPLAQQSRCWNETLEIRDKFRLLYTVLRSKRVR